MYVRSMDTAIPLTTVAEAVALLARQLADLTAEPVGDAEAMAAVGAALGAADDLAAAVIALLGQTTHRGVVAEEGVTISTWLRVFGRRTSGDERMLTATVERLQDMPTVRRWFHEGAVSWPAVRGIVAAVRNLTREQRRWVDATFAEHGDALCRLEADRIVSAAERLAEQARPDLHEARERRAFAGRRLAIHPRLDGSSHVSGEFDAESTATLLAGLAAAEDAVPAGDTSEEIDDKAVKGHNGSDRHDADVSEQWDGHDGRRQRHERSNADRLVGIVSAYLAGRGGVRARPSMIVVTDVGVFDDRANGRTTPARPTAQLLWNCHTGPVELTASAAQRLACEATLRHVLVDGDTVLGASAAHPAVSASLRAALVVRDGGCRFPGCRAPVDRCDNHHLVFRVHGGRTVLDNLALLCDAHHHAVHDSGWATTLHADGTLDFTRNGRTITSHPRTAHRVAAGRPPPRGRPRRGSSMADPPSADPSPVIDEAPRPCAPLPF
jgi:hypothetical protein